MKRAKLAALLLSAVPLVVSAATVSTAAVAPPDASGVAGKGELLGFSAASAAAESALEQRFDAGVLAADQRGWLERLTAAPNHVGSAHDKANADFIAASFREWGWEVSIERFSVLYPTPREVLLELVAPTHVVAQLREPAVPGDATSTQTAAELPAYNVYGADGDVSGDLVYVNQGMPADYRELERRGISVKGHIVLVRYGGGWRGLKPKLAYQHGALGCLLYSDPRDDGYGGGDVYPRGGYRPAHGIQRGSVQDIVLYSGDPLTPGIGATADARRLALEDAKTLLKIPVLPISYADATPLLEALGGPVAPPDWRGGLPLTYHIGPGPARTHLKIRSDWNQKTLYDVIARIRGSVEPDRWVIRGNHHDAWVFGATDPMSGTVALMSEGKAIGQLLKAGFRPRRSVVYASWDGEEPGLLGSTEWAETHAAELERKAIVYVNTDMNERGFLLAGGSAAWRRFVTEAARDVKDPETGASILDRALAADRQRQFEESTPMQSTPLLRDDTQTAIPLQALGSGSDYSPFLQHLGISAIDLGFGGESDYGVYHSAYDSFDHFRRFVDPRFAYGVALAQVSGRLVLRAAQSELLPTQTAAFAQAVAGYAEELHALADAMRSRTAALERLLDDGTFVLTANPAAPRAAPQREARVPYLNFAALDNAIERLKASAAAFDAAYAASLVDQKPTAVARRERFNVALTTLEETLTDRHGLPGRDWYRHMIYAPGLNTGYAAKTLPGIREAIEERRWDEANQYMSIVANSLDAYRATLERAVAGEPAVAGNDAVAGEGAVAGSD